MQELVIKDLEGVKSKIVSEIQQLQNLLSQTRNQIAELVEREKRLVDELNLWSRLITFEEKDNATVTNSNSEEDKEAAQ